VVGFVSSLRALSQYLCSRNLRCSGVSSVLTAAEPLFDEDRILIRESLNANIYNTYGSREFMSVAAECEFHSGLHVNAENLIVESVQVEPEETPEIIITDLHNHGMPFIRYRIGDSGCIDNTPCRCGRNLPRLYSIQGRVLDLLTLPNGDKVGGGAFCHLFKDIAEIKEFQVEQTSVNHIEVRVVLRQELSQGSRDSIDTAFRILFGDTSVVRLKEVSEIPRTQSGKRRVTIGLN
ncbi:MAG TPA: hypothetical protein VH744_14375, partial [Terriglobales bacterium]